MVGAASLTCGVTRSISTAIITLELTGQWHHLFPIFTATIIAYAVGNVLTASFYEVVLALKGTPSLPKLRREYGADAVVLVGWLEEEEEEGEEKEEEWITFGCTSRGGCINRMVLPCDFDFIPFFLFYFFVFVTVLCRAYSRTASEIMRRDVVVVTPTDSLADVAEMLEEHDYTSFPCEVRRQRGWRV